MFKRLTKIFKRGPVAKANEKPGGEPSPFSRGPTAPPAPDAAAGSGLPGRPGRAAARGKPADTKAAADVKKQWEAQASQSISKSASREELCGITEGMSTDELRERLATLYRRHNRAASSLDEKLRDEAEHMLEAIAALREKYLDKK